MKYLLSTLLVVLLSFTAAVAQEKTLEKFPQEKMMSKEDKSAAKAKKEANLVEAFNKAGLTADEQQKFRAIIDENSASNKAVKMDASLSDDQKIEKSKENAKVRESKLKELLGDDKYKLLKSTQKEQKAAAKM